MKTNIPFQAPGINAPPRGKGQEEGTNPKEVGKNIKKVIKEQTCEWAGCLRLLGLLLVDEQDVLPASVFGSQLAAAVQAPTDRLYCRCCTAVQLTPTPHLWASARDHS